MKYNLQLGMILSLFLLSGMAQASTITINIFPNNAQNLSQGFSTFIDSSSSPTGLNLNYSSQVALNIIGMSTIHTTTSSGVVTTSPNALLSIVAPKFPKANAVIH